MQNRYVGDIGDFGKYALLRSIARTGLHIGVNWYLTPNEAHNADGKHTSYLNRDSYKGYDDELYCSLKDIVDSGKRDVRSVQNSNILPLNTALYDIVLDLSGESNPKTRSMLRQSWHFAALNKLKNSDIAFLDPDNGLQVKSVSLTGQKGNKYVGLDELKDYYKLGKSIIFYNHRERKQEDEYLDKFRQLSNSPALQGADWLGFKFVGGTTRDYIFILQSKHFYPIKLQCDSLLNTIWKTHFTKLYF